MSNKKSIIKPTEKESFKVEKYSFKNLTHLENDVSQQDRSASTSAVNNEHSASEDTKLEESPAHNFENILKKHEELVSENVALQIKLEQQQVDHEQQLKDEIKTAHDEAVEKTLADVETGLYDALAQSKETYLVSIEKLDDFLVRANKAIENIEAELSKTAIEVAHEIIQKELSTHSQEIAHALALSLTESLSSQNKIELKVNPEDYDFINEAFKEKKHILIQSDNAISKGGVVILSDAENIDANIKTRFENVKKLIK